MLARRSPSHSRSAATVVVVTTLFAGSGYAAWAAQPVEQITSAPTAALRRPTSALAEPPAGLLTGLERKRHARFLTQAKAGNIHVVFIGDGEVDYWKYDNSGNPEWNNHSGGKAEWDKDYIPLRAVNFGVEGAQTRSVLWRLQNGELEGMKPKVVVVSTLGIADAVDRGIEVPQIIGGNRAIVAEIRRRQPQAKILLVAVPRGQPTTISRQVMKPVNDQLAKLADNQWIYYLDLNPRLLASDGTLDPTLHQDSLGQVLSPKGYAAWAEAMNPTLFKLLR
jgi:lysophospholipase L1-like esterase